MRVITILVLVLCAGTANAKPEPKCAVQKGDQAACQAEATQKCSGFDRYDKTDACVRDIAVKYEQCGTPAMQKDAKEATDLVEICGNASFEDTMSHHLESERERKLAGWLERVAKVDAAAARFTKLNATWEMCEDSWHFRGDICKDAPKKYASTFASAVDDAIASVRFDEGKKSLKDDDEHDHAVARNMAEDASKTAEKYLAINAKLPQSYRHGVKELEALKAEAAKLGAAYEKTVDAEVASRGCPSGKKLGGTYLKTLDGLIGRDKVKKRIIRQSESLSRFRDGLITREAVPVIVCSQRIADGKPKCDVAKFTVYREKAPSSPWTSWDVSVGGGWEINCQKLK